MIENVTEVQSKIISHNHVQMQCGIMIYVLLTLYTAAKLKRNLLILKLKYIFGIAIIIIMTTISLI